MFKSTLILVVTFYIVTKNVNALIYDSFSGKPIDKTLLDYYREVDLVYRCTNEFKPCDPNEPRRVNGTCNNLHHPSIGGINTPPRRLLPPVFFEGDNPRKSHCGEDLPMVRKVRTEVLGTGKVASAKHTQLLTYSLVFLSTDVISIQDTVNYISHSKHCCEPEKTNDPYKVCFPHEIPSDDPVHRFSKYRCQNQTKPLTFQKYGCKVNSTTPTRVITATSTIDLSNVYDVRFSIFKRDEFFDKRSYVNGSLKHEIDENGILWPLSAPEERSICERNVKPRETRCHDTLSNGVLGTNLFTIWFYRYHVKVAAHLAEMNPCWNDDQIFHTAMDINIAVYSQIMFYEMFPAIFGRKNLIRDGIISYSSLYRDMYDESLKPLFSEECMYMFRWFHTMQDCNIKQYNTDGNFVKSIPVGNLTFRTGYLAVDDNLPQITQGSFRQPCGKNDYIVHPDMANVGLGLLQEVMDIITNDLAKSRLIGFQPYIKYREFCTNKKYKTFDDLSCDISEENIELLKGIYKHVSDIDLMAGVWLEKRMPGGEVPPTLYCLMVEQLSLITRYDRFWYESQYRPNAFTPRQMIQIRKSNIASLLCEVGDGVTKIQPHAFYKITRNNRLRKCKFLPKVNLNAWKDESCKNGIDTEILDKNY